jgi:hypothetical protein
VRDVFASRAEGGLFLVSFCSCIFRHISHRPGGWGAVESFGIQSRYALLPPPSWMTTPTTMPPSDVGVTPAMLKVAPL